MDCCVLFVVENSYVNAQIARVHRCSRLQASDYYKENIEGHASRFRVDRVYFQFCYGRSLYVQKVFGVFLFVDVNCGCQGVYASGRVVSFNVDRFCDDRVDANVGAKCVETLLFGVRANKWWWRDDAGGWLRYFRDSCYLLVG